MMFALNKKSSFSLLKKNQNRESQGNSEKSELDYLTSIISFVKVF